MPTKTANQHVPCHRDCWKRTSACRDVSSDRPHDRQRGTRPEGIFSHAEPALAAECYGRRGPDVQQEIAVREGLEDLLANDTHRRQLGICQLSTCVARFLLETQGVDAFTP